MLLSDILAHLGYCATHREWSDVYQRLISMLSERVPFEFSMSGHRLIKFLTSTRVILVFSPGDKVCHNWCPTPGRA
jgi:hypothetical protein